MSTIYVNRAVTEPERRASIFEGNYYIYTALPSALALCEHARELVAEAFDGADPQRAHHAFALEEFVARVGPLKSRFTNSARSKELCQKLALELGVDPDDTYFDVPRLRVIPPSSYLSSGVSYNYRAHRDTWYAHPPCLVNYWVPVCPVVGDNVMAMFPRYWGKPVANRSAEFDYDRWVRESRFKAAEQVKSEERPHPTPLEPVDTAGEIRFAGSVGDVLMFSTCQLHASAPNTTDLVRFSYDLRTISMDDYTRGRGPRNVDSAATGTTVGDFLRVSDLAPFDVKLPAAALLA